MWMDPCIYTNLTNENFSHLIEPNYIWLQIYIFLKKEFKILVLQNKKNLFCYKT